MHRNNVTHYCLFIIFLVGLSRVFGQPDSVTYIPSLCIETGAIGSFGKQTPFWMVSNKYGKYSLSKAMFFSSAKLNREFSSSKDIDGSYGLEGYARIGKDAGAYLHQWYVGGKFWFARIWAGAREEIYGNQDDLLSSGGLLWSGNARPMPKIMMDVPEYTTVPFTFKLVEFKGGMGHGWFDDDRYVKDAWLHHKYGYIRFGGWLPVKFHYGMHHFAQWGGVSTDPDIGQLPGTLEDFKYIFLAKDRGEDPDIPWGEWYNKIGNHIGSRNFGLDVTLEKFDAGLYWQTIFEDGSGKAYRNIKDGLWGLYFNIKDDNNARNFSLNRIVLEYVNTTDQSGPINRDSAGYETGGSDNYFNNSIYRTGWSYRYMTIGTPFITSPLFNGEKFLFYNNIRNNKNRGIHLGLGGNVHSIEFTLKYSVFKSFGTNYYPFSAPTVTHSTSIEIKSRLRACIQFKGFISGDISAFYGNNLGIGISILKGFL